MTLSFAENAIPSLVVTLCQRLDEQGFSAHLVGGSIRDLLLGREVHDWDVATAAPPEQVQRIFPRTIPTGIKHGTVTVCLAPSFLVEVTTYRGEGAYSDARHPDTVHFVSSIEEDLSRRDFTINAMAYDVIRHHLVDPLQGRADVKHRLIRAVGDPAVRFGEDALRTMRAVRFAAVLGFAIESQTYAAIPRALERFRRVARERVRDELLKLLTADRPSHGIELLRGCGLLQEILPELLPGVGLMQNRYHGEDVYQHSLRVCDETKGDALLRLTALLHDVGKPGVARPRPDCPTENSFVGHESAGAQLGLDIAHRLKLSNAQQQRLVHLIDQHMFPLQGWSPAGLRRLLRRVQPEYLDDFFALRRGDLRAKSASFKSPASDSVCEESRRPEPPDPSAPLEPPEQPEQLKQLEQLRERLTQLLASPLVLAPPDLAIDGHTIMKRLGIGPGPAVGKILHRLVEEVIEDPSLNSAEQLLRRVDELKKNGALDIQGTKQ